YSRLWVPTRTAWLRAFQSTPSFASAWIALSAVFIEKPFVNRVGFLERDREGSFFLANREVLDRFSLADDLDLDYFSVLMLGSKLLRGSQSCVRNRTRPRKAARMLSLPRRLRPLRRRASNKCSNGAH